MIGLYGGVFLIPLFTQNLMLMTPFETGLLLMPAALVTAVMMPISGFLFDRFGAKVLAIIGLAVTGLGTLGLHNLNLNTSNFVISFLAALRSMGIGLAMMPITTAGMNTVPVNQIGRASALNNVCRQVAGSFGIAVLTAVMQNRQAFHYARLSEAVSIDSPANLFVSQLSGYLGNAGAGSGAKSAAIAVLSGLVSEESLVWAIDDTFIVAALFIFIAIPLAFFLNKPKKKATSPQTTPAVPVKENPAGPGKKLSDSASI